MADYTGLNFHEVGQLNYVQYLIWRRDAYIHLLSRTEEGQKHLDECWRMEQVKADRASLRHKVRKEE